MVDDRGDDGDVEDGDVDERSRASVLVAADVDHEPGEHHDADSVEHTRDPQTPASLITIRTAARTSEPASLCDGHDHRDEQDGETDQHTAVPRREDAEDSDSMNRSGGVEERHHDASCQMSRHRSVRLDAVRRIAVSIPLVVALSVLTMVGCSNTDEPGILTAIDNRDGSTSWRADIESLPIQVLNHGSVVLVAGVSDCDGNGRIAAFDRTTGEPRWSAPFEGGYSESAAADGVLFTGTRDGMIARRSTDGAQQWAADRFGAAQLQVAAGDQVLVIGANDAGPFPRHPAEVVSLDPDTGETRWATSLDGAGQIVDVAIADGLAIVRTTGTSTDDAGTTVIIGVSLSVGHIRWRHDLGISEVSKPLLVSTDTVVVDLLKWAWASDEPRRCRRERWGVVGGRRPGDRHRILALADRPRVRSRRGPCECRVVLAEWRRTRRAIGLRARRVGRVDSRTAVDGAPRRG